MSASQAEHCACIRLLADDLHLYRLQTAVKVGDIANVNVAANGQTSVMAPGTKVKVDGTKDVKGRPQ